MKLLILGGTKFLGHHLVHSATKAGHEVTVFTRGRTAADGLPDGVIFLTGDRDGNLTALEGGKWDAAIDTSGYVPRIVRQSALLLANLADHYTFVSSISVYSGLDQPGCHEDSPSLQLEDPATEDVPSHYGALKALCEREVADAFPGRSLIIRPGLIVGPRDPTDRFTYWPSRLRRGGEVLAPGKPDAQVQVIDVRDLSEWIIRLVERKRSGTYNATGPATRLSMFEFLEQCRSALNPQAALIWADQDFLLENGVGPWIEMPLWIPGVGETADVAFLMAADKTKAMADGLTFRPLIETIRDTANWDASRPAYTERHAGMAGSRETGLLADWKDKQNDQKEIERELPF